MSNTSLLNRAASGLTIAALIRTAFEILDIYQSSANQHPDFRRLNLRLEVEKCRLQAWVTWAENVGDVEEQRQSRPRSQSRPQRRQRPPIEELRFPDTVRGVLESLLGLFDSAEGVRERYWDVRMDGGDGGRWWLTALVARARDNVVWVVRDRWRFTRLVDEIRALLDRLVEITAAPVGGRVGNVTMTTTVTETAKDVRTRDVVDHDSSDSRSTVSSRDYSDSKTVWPYPSSREFSSGLMGDNTWIPSSGGRRMGMIRYRGSKL